MPGRGFTAIMVKIAKRCTVNHDTQEREEKPSVADAFGTLREISAEENEFEAPPREDRPNPFADDPPSRSSDLTTP